MSYQNSVTGGGGGVYDPRDGWNSRLLSVEKEIRNQSEQEYGNELIQAYLYVNKARAHLARHQNNSWFYEFCEEREQLLAGGEDQTEGEA